MTMKSQPPLLLDPSHPYETIYHSMNGVESTQLCIIHYLSSSSISITPVKKMAKQLLTAVALVGFVLHGIEESISRNHGSSVVASKERSTSFFNGEVPQPYRMVPF